MSHPTAQAIRAALSACSVQISVALSLEVAAAMHGARNWQTLNASPIPLLTPAGARDALEARLSKAGFALGPEVLNAVNAQVTGMKSGPGADGQEPAPRQTTPKRPEPAEHGEPFDLKSETARTRNTPEHPEPLSISDFFKVQGHVYVGGPELIAELEFLHSPDGISIQRQLLEHARKRALERDRQDQQDAVSSEVTEAVPTILVRLHPPSGAVRFRPPPLNSDLRLLTAVLQVRHPELAHWSQAVLYDQWQAYCQAESVRSASMCSARDEDFIARLAGLQDAERLDALNSGAQVRTLPNPDEVTPEMQAIWDRTSARLADLYGVNLHLPWEHALLRALILRTVLEGQRSLTGLRDAFTAARASLQAGMPPERLWVLDPTWDARTADDLWKNDMTPQETHLVRLEAALVQRGLGDSNVN